MFQVAAGQFDEPVMAVLGEGIDTGSRNLLEAAANVLREAPRRLFWKEVEFVRRILQAAAQHGDECVRRVGGQLHSAVMEGTRSGTTGQPFPEDVEQREKAGEIADRLPEGSLEERFYRSLRESAESSIRWDMDRDDQFLDARDW